MAEDVSILSEIDEALRADSLQLFWARHARTLIVFGVLCVLATAGSTFWKSHMRDQHERQTSLLAKAAGAEGDGKFEEAAGYYAQAETSGGSLAALAGVRHATMLIGMKQQDKALALYADVVSGKFGDAAPALRDYANLETAILTSNKNTDPKSQSKPAEADIFRASMREIVALNDLKAGDNKGASDLFSSILADESAPYSERVRAAELLDSVKEHRK